MVANDFREWGTKILMPCAERIPLNPMAISLLSLMCAIFAGYFFLFGRF